MNPKCKTKYIHLGGKNTIIEVILERRAVQSVNVLYIFIASSLVSMLNVFDCKMYMAFCGLVRCTSRAERPGVNMRCVETATGEREKGMSPE